MAAVALLPALLLYARAPRPDGVAADEEAATP
jgi:hypothetical protein